MDQLVNQTQQKMGKVLTVLREDLATVRTGRATPSLVEHIVINAYGGPPAGGTRLKVMELATIHTSDPQTLIITPFDASIVGEIQKGILEANVGLTPMIEGTIIRITVPSLSEERRRELTKLMQQKLENGRIMIRQVRQEAMSQIKKQGVAKVISEDEMVRIEKEVQRVTVEASREIDALGKKKEEELMQL